jgi:hypothetical protein
MTRVFYTNFQYYHGIYQPIEKYVFEGKTLVQAIKLDLETGNHKMIDKKRGIYNV